MVNSKKKINKSTVAIVVLALLLVLSLVLTATGAWFTDTKTTTSSQVDGKFGVVKIADFGDAAYKVNEWTGIENSKLVPGSKLSVAGGSIENAGNVSIYVKMKATTTVKIGGVEYDLTDAVTKENGEDVTGKTLADYFNFGEIEVADGTTKVEGSTAMYLLGYTGSDKATDITIKGFEVEIKTALPNTLNITHDGANSEVVFNRNGEDATEIGVEVSIDFKVAAVQVQNITVTDAEKVLDDLLAA